MYQDEKLIKQNIFKGLLDDYETEDVNEVIALTKKQKGTFVRDAILHYVNTFHAGNSIGREPAQQDFLKERESA